MALKKYIYLLLWMIGIWLVSRPLSQILPIELGQMDLQQYWAAAKAFIGRENPYQLSSIIKYESQLDIIKDGEWIRMWNPPLILSLIWPLALCDFKQAAALWSLLNFSLLLVILRNLDSHLRAEGSDRKVRLSLLAALITFYPLVSTILYGQISFIILFGLTLFLLLKDPFLRGLALSLTLIKPHLLYLVYLAILLESLRVRDLKILLGMLAGALALILPVLAYLPDTLFWYISALKEPPIYFKTPTLGSWLQELIGYQHSWARITPTVLTIICYLAYGLKRIYSGKDGFLTVEHIVLLLPITLLTAPYGWIFDQALLLPCILYIVHSSHKRPKPVPNLTVATLCLAGILVFLLPFEGQQYYVWYPMVIGMMTIILLQSSPSSRPGR